ncbi:MAG TPA: permease prefix domain 1-containing protein [Streptosporangiaceae bacterium]
MSDPIQDYLGRLRAGLRTGDAARIMAEAEDHLSETVAAGLAAGLTEREAQEAAVSAFGSVTAVVRAHETRPRNLIRGRTPAAVLGDLLLSAWKLGAVGLTAVGVSGLVVAAMNAMFGRSFTGQPPAGMTFPKAECAYWMSAWTGAHTCAQAAMLEASSDAVVLRLMGGFFGVAFLGAYLVARHVILPSRGHRPGMLLGGYFPVLAMCVFGAGALGLALAQLTGFAVTAGPGTYLSGAIVATVVAVCYGYRARPVIRHLVRVAAR